MDHSILDQKEIVIYESSDTKTQFVVPIIDDSVWLSQKQIAKLFDKSAPTINEHIKNIFKEKELSDRDSVIRKFRITAEDGKRYQVEHYNLDVIISVGYRVKSVQGTQFRIWANQVLKDHIIKGYSLNKNRLSQVNWEEFDQTIKLVKNISKEQLLSSPESLALLDIISKYTKTFVLLQSIDTDSLETPPILTPALIEITLEQYRHAVKTLKQTLIDKQMASELFGQERGESFKGIVGALYQTFGGQDLYPSIEEKASHLLYFIIKDHPFSDGNKRSAAFLFIWFLSQNHHLYRSGLTPKLNDNALVALTLLIAESKPTDKDVMIRLVMHLLT